jgi:hypothetical protein
MSELLTAAQVAVRWWLGWLVLCWIGQNNPQQIFNLLKGKQDEYQNMATPG